MTIEIHRNSPDFNTGERARPTFVTAGGQIYRATAQGGLRRLTPLDLALMANAAPVAIRRIEIRREEG